MQVAWLFQMSVSEWVHAWVSEWVFRKKLVDSTMSDDPSIDCNGNSDSGDDSKTNDT